MGGDGGGRVFKGGVEHMHCCTGLLAPLAVGACDQGHLISLLGLRQFQQQRYLCGHLSAENNL